MISVMRKKRTELWNLVIKMENKVFMYKLKCCLDSAVCGNLLPDIQCGDTSVLHNYNCPKPTNLYPLSVMVLFLQSYLKILCS